MTMRLLLDTIETYIFSFAGLRDEYGLPGRRSVKRLEESSLEWRQYQLEELQSAYLITVLQYWTGNVIAKKRARQQRFSRIVAVSFLSKLCEPAKMNR
jgi:hypothetical protein